MTPQQLRTALHELNGERDLVLAFAGLPDHLTILNAMLIPDEPDHLVKVTDGSSVFILEAERVVWFRIGLRKVH
jgi:hypothetical protein